LNVDRPSPCPNAVDWRQTTLANLCGKRFLVGNVEHGCGSCMEHQPRTVHACVCGARYFETATKKATDDRR